MISYYYIEETRNYSKENGIKKTLNKNSGIIRIKESRLKTAKRNNDIETIKKLEKELQ